MGENNCTPVITVPLLFVCAEKKGHYLKNPA